MPVRTGGRAVVEALEGHGIRHVFGVPGESFLDFLDAARDSKVRFVNCRQEGGAAMCAEATGKATGKAGVAFVTRAPGATNAAAGVFVAHQDATPMVLLVGQVGREFRGRRAFQELDYGEFFGGFAKAVFEAENPGAVGELVVEALAVAESGRAGPVVLAMPEDVLAAEADAPPAPRTREECAPDGEAVKRAAEMIERSKAPLFVIGGSGWTEGARRDLERIAADLGAPVTATFRRMSLFDALHPCYAGDLGIGSNPELLALIGASDLLVVVGDELSEVPSQGYTLVGIPDPGVDIIHVMPSPDEIGRIFRPALGIASTPAAFLRPFAERLAGASRTGRARAAHESYLRWSSLPEKGEGSINDECIRWMLDNLPADSVVTNGAGNYCAWLNRYYRFTRFMSLLGPVSGSMGYGLPAAIAQKLADPARTVVCLAGDGCLQMTIQELGTAVQENLAFPIVVFDNRQYGTIRMHQEKRFPGRVSATRLENPDFAALAGAYGCGARTVSEPPEFGSAMEDALKSDRPFLVRVMCDPDVLAPGLALG